MTCGAPGQRRRGLGELGRAVDQVKWAEKRDPRAQQCSVPFSFLSFYFLISFLPFSYSSSNFQIQTNLNSYFRLQIFPLSH